MERRIISASDYLTKVDPNVYTFDPLAQSIMDKYDPLVALHPETMLETGGKIHPVSPIQTMTPTIDQPIEQSPGATGGGVVVTVGTFNDWIKANPGIAVGAGLVLAYGLYLLIKNKR